MNEMKFEKNHHHYQKLTYDHKLIHASLSMYVRHAILFTEKCTLLNSKRYLNSFIGQCMLLNCSILILHNKRVNFLRPL